MTDSLDNVARPERGGHLSTPAGPDRSLREACYCAMFQRRYGLRDTVALLGGVWAHHSKLRRIGRILLGRCTYCGRPDCVD